MTAKDYVLKHFPSAIPTTIVDEKDRFLFYSMELISLPFIEAVVDAVDIEDLWEIAKNAIRIYKRRKKIELYETQRA